MSTTKIALISNTTTDHETLDALIDRYRALRVHALKNDPQAFGSKYTDELHFPREKWQARIQKPIARTFIALDDTANVHSRDKCSPDRNDALPALLTRKWVGTLTVVGPKAIPDVNKGAKELLDLFKMSQAKSSGREVQGPFIAYMLNGMYVVPEERNRGRGRRLVQEVIGYARKAGEAAEANQVWVLAFVEVENHSAFGFYLKAGFQAWGEEVLLGNRYVRMLAFKGTI